jgi:plastocyanin
MSNSGHSNQNNTTNNASNISTLINFSQTSTNTQNKNSFSSISNQPQSSTNDISVTSAGFSPSTVTITAGSQVKWTNNTTSVVYVAPDDARKVSRRLE